MKTITLSLIALATLTGAALANDRAEEGTVASRNVYNGAVWANAPASNDTQALAVMADDNRGVSDYALRIRAGDNFGEDRGMSN